MDAILIDVSRYVFAALMMIYVFASFGGTFSHNEYTRRTVYATQNVLMYVIHFMGYMILFMKDENMNFIILYIAQVVFFAVFILMYSRLYPTASRLLINNMCMLMVLGFMMIARLSYAKCLRQFIIAAAGSMISLFIPWLLKKVKSFRNFAPLYFALGIIPLVIVLMGDKVFGAKLVLSIGSLSMQPTEFIKIIFVLFVGAMFNKSTSFAQIVITSIAAALHVIILVVSNDLGAALIFFVVYIMMLYAATRKWYWLVAGAAAGSVAAYIAYTLFLHVRVRVLVWLDPWTYFEDRGYQICQSLFSLGTGSWLGTGFYEGTPGMIPVPEKDFIFSALTEEFGMIFTIGMIMICLNNLILIMNIASSCKTQFYRLVAIGLGVTYAFQVFLTIGGGIKLIPLTGVTLPFVSYGGSSMVSSLLLFALINGMYSMRAEERQTKAVIKKRNEKTATKKKQKMRNV